MSYSHTQHTWVFILTPIFSVIVLIQATPWEPRAAIASSVLLTYPAHLGIPIFSVIILIQATPRKPRAAIASRVLLTYPAHLGIHSHAYLLCHYPNSSNPSGPQSGNCFTCLTHIPTTPGYSSSCLVSSVTANVTISSVSAGWSASVKVVVLPKVTVDLPRHDLTAVKNLPHLQGLALADPYFHQPRRVDLILDSDIFDEILMPRGHLPHPLPGRQNWAGVSWGGILYLRPSPLATVLSTLLLFLLLKKTASTQC